MFGRFIRVTAVGLTEDDFGTVYIAIDHIVRFDDKNCHNDKYVFIHTVENAMLKVKEDIEDIKNQIRTVCWRQANEIKRYG